MSEIPSRVATAKRAAAAGAEIALDGFRTRLRVDTKTDATDVVTEADREAQRRAAAVIRETYPDEPIVGEEAGERDTVPSGGYAWVIDPIDGTNNYVRERHTFATVVAVVSDGTPSAAAINLPALDDVYVAGGQRPTRNGEPIRVSDVSDPSLATVTPTIWWPRDRRDEYAAACREVVTRFDDIRRVGCAQATLAAVADGGLDGAFTNLTANPWDSIAGVQLIREAGGRVTDIDGDRWRHDSTGLVVSNGGIHDSVLAAATETEAARR